MVWGKTGFPTCLILLSWLLCFIYLLSLINSSLVIQFHVVLLQFFHYPPHWVSQVDFSSFIISPVFLNTYVYAEHLELWYLPFTDSFTITFLWCEVTTFNYSISCLCPFFFNLSLKTGGLPKAVNPNQVIIHILKRADATRPALKDQCSPYNHTFV